MLQQKKQNEKINVFAKVNGKRIDSLLLRKAFM